MNSSKVTIEWSNELGGIGSGMSGASDDVSLGSHIGTALQRCGDSRAYLALAQAVQVITEGISGDARVDAATEELINAARKVREEWARFDREWDHAQP